MRSRRDRSGLSPRRTDRGQSVSINYTVSLVIVTVLMSGLFISMSGFLETEQKRATRSELTVLGNRIAADIATVDRLARTSNGGSVEVRTTIPRSVAGSEYEVDVSSSQFKGASAAWNVTITLRGSDVDVSRTVEARTTVEVADSDLNGGPYVVSYDGTTIEVDDE